MGYILGDEDPSVKECLSKINTEFRAVCLDDRGDMAGEFYIEVEYTFNKMIAGYVWVSLLDSNSESFVLASEEYDDRYGKPCLNFICYFDVFDQFSWPYFYREEMIRFLPQNDDLRSFLYSNAIPECKKYVEKNRVRISKMIEDRKKQNKIKRQEYRNERWDENGKPKTKMNITVQEYVLFGGLIILLVFILAKKLMG